MIKFISELCMCILQQGVPGAAGEVFENKMSDVVKGTAKPLTRECNSKATAGSCSGTTTPPTPASTPCIQIPTTSPVTAGSTTTMSSPIQTKEKLTSVEPVVTSSLPPTPPQSPQK